LYIIILGLRVFENRVLKRIFRPKKAEVRTMALDSTQPVTAMSIRGLSGAKGWPSHKADNLSAICEPIV
jgi:hypothetical protein